MDVILETAGGIVRTLQLRYQQSALVGRHPDADFSIPDDSTMARLHFALQRTRSAFLLRDLQSERGTLVNGCPVHEAIVRSGDLITAGQTQLRITVPEIDRQAIEHTGKLTRIARRTVDQFYREMYLEHLEEAAFLYEHRQRMLADPELAWRAVHDEELRFEAHVDALVVGGALATSVCRERAADGDPGELHTALRVFFRVDRLDLVRELLTQLDVAEAPRLAAAADALRDELPVEWHAHFLCDVIGSLPQVQLAAAKLVDLQRLQAARMPTTRATRPIQGIFRRLAERLQSLEAMDPLLSQLLHHGEPDVRTFHALSLLSLGETSILETCRAKVRSDDWPLIPLALAGGHEDCDVLIERAIQEPSPDVFLALGLLGDVRAIDALLIGLTTNYTAGSAALGLHVMTGAPLVETATVAEIVDEGELFPHELELLRQGKWNPPGQEVRRLTRCARQWQQWWDEHRADFPPEYRYRCGERFHPQVLVAMLWSSGTPHRLRQYAYQELVIRYCLDIPFDTELFVDTQQRLLCDIENWSQKQAASFAEGHWYLAGIL